MNWNSPTAAKIRSATNRPLKKPPPVELTEGEKARLIKDFVSVMERAPTEEEISELVSEELKIKQGG